LSFSSSFANGSTTIQVPSFRNEQSSEAEQSTHPYSAQHPSPETVFLVNDTIEAAGPEKEQGQAVNEQRYILWFTGILAAASIFQFFTLLFTYGLMRRTARQQLRAYISVENCYVVVESSPRRAVVIIKNGGQTPAYEVDASIRSMIEKYPLEGTLPNDKIGESSISPMGPHSEDRLTVQCALHTPEETVLFVYGKVSYTDAFKKIRHTEYRYIYAPGECL